MSKWSSLPERRMSSLRSRSRGHGRSSWSRSERLPDSLSNVSVQLAAEPSLPIQPSARRDGAVPVLHVSRSDRLLHEVRHVGDCGSHHCHSPRDFARAVGIEAGCKCGPRANGLPSDSSRVVFGKICRSIWGHDDPSVRIDLLLNSGSCPTLIWSDWRGFLVKRLSNLADDND